MDNIKSGAFIKQKRKEKGFTQKELAEILNCTDKAVSRWETGKGFPEVSLLIPLSNALNVSVNEIILGEDIEKENFIEKSNGAIVETIKSSNKRIKNTHIVLYALIVIFETFVFYVPALMASPGDEMAVVLLGVGGVALCSFVLGLLKTNLLHKLIFIPITLALFIPSTFIHFTISSFFDYALPYSGFFIILSAALILISSGFSKLFSVMIAK